MEFLQQQADIYAEKVWRTPGDRGISAANMREQNSEQLQTGADSAQGAPAAGLKGDAAWKLLQALNCRRRSPSGRDSNAERLICRWLSEEKKVLMPRRDF